MAANQQWGDRVARCRGRFCVTGAWCVTVCVIAIAWAVLARPAHAGGWTAVLHVDAAAPPGGNGHTWTTAFRHLQDALTACDALTPPVLVKVAQGVYRPDQGVGFTLGDRTASFWLREGVTLEGGYAGLGGADPDEWNLAFYRPVLSGDLLGNDDLDDPFNVALTADNSQHVVRGVDVSDATELNGFEIRSGNTTGSTLESGGALCGGGIALSGGAPWIVNCIVRWNFSHHCGGGIHTATGSGNASVFVNCLVVENNCHISSGIQVGGPITMVNCTVANNAPGAGNGFWFNQGSLVMRNSIVWGNGGPPTSFAQQDVTYSCVDGGHAGVGNIASDPFFEGMEAGNYRLHPQSPCIDAGDSDEVPIGIDTDLDGAQRIFLREVDMGCFEFAAPLPGSVEFVGSDGGSWFNPGNWSNGKVPTGSDLVYVSGHVTIGSGSAEASQIRMAAGTLELLPKASLSVGSVEARHSSHLLVRDGASLFASGAVTADSHSVILIESEAVLDALIINLGPTAVLDVRGSHSVQTGHLYVDPDAEVRLTVPSERKGPLIVVSEASHLAGTLHVDYWAGFKPVLGMQVKLIDGAVSGQFDLVVFSSSLEDIRQIIRVSASGLWLVFIGEILYVNALATSEGFGQSWETAYADLQLALAQAHQDSEFSQIWVAKGIYRPGLKGSPPDTSFVIPNGVSVFGGFPVGATDLEQRDFVLFESILCGDLNGDDEPGFVNRSDNSQHVIRLHPSGLVTTIDGFTIRGGNSSAASQSGLHGSAIWSVSASVTARNIRCEDNLGTAFRIELVSGRVGSFHMVVVYDSGGCSVILPLGATFEASDSAFPVYAFTTGESLGGYLLLERCILSGAGISRGTALIRNSWIHGSVGAGFATLTLANSSVTGGTVTCAFDSTVWIRNSTVSNGGGVFIRCRGRVRIQNSIVWGNLPADLHWDQDYHPTCNVSDRVVVGNSIIGSSQIGWCGTAPLFMSCWQPVISTNPMFVSPDGPDGIPGTLDDDFRLLPGSPAIDLGNADFYSIPNYGNLDLAGNPRFINGTTGEIGGIIDLGPYEFQPQAPVLETWWNRAQPFGFFDVPTHWTHGMPGVIHQAGFDRQQAAVSLPGAYIVFMPESGVTSHNVVHASDAVSLAFAGADYELVGQDTVEEPSLVIGTRGGEQPDMEVENFETGAATFRTRRISIGDASGSDGRLRVVGSTMALRAWDDVFIGRRGFGDLRVRQGADFHLTGRTMSLGTESGGDGRLLVSDPGSIALLEGYSTAARIDLNVGDVGKGLIEVTSGAAVNATQFAGTMKLGVQPESEGTLRIDGANSGLWYTGASFVAGQQGDGRVRVLGGGFLQTTTFGPVILSNSSQATADVLISGAGSTWLETTSPSIFVGLEGPAMVTIADGGVLSAPNVTISGSGEIGGDGTIFAGNRVTNLGQISPFSPLDPATGEPGGRGAGTLVIDGDYRQVGQPVGGGVDSSGRLRVILGAGAEPGLLVTGTAELGGGLFVELEEGFDPGPSGPQSTQSVLVADSIDPAFSRFDVAFMPGLSDGRFLRVAYGAPQEQSFSGPSGEGVQIVVDLLKNLLGFGGGSEVGIAGGPTAIVVADFDGKNGDDIAVSVRGETPSDPGSVFILYNDGGGTSFTVEQVTVGREPLDLVSGDFTGNGRLDLAVANSADNQVRILVNTVSGFTDGALINVGSVPSGLAAGDLAGTGEVDLAVANTGANTVQILENQGGGTFVSGAVIAVGPNPTSIAAGDLLVGTGVDLVVANSGGNTVEILRNNGGGAFSGWTAIIVPPGPKEVDIPDLDGNKDIDIVVTSVGVPSVSIIRNLGGDVFAPAVSLMLDAEPVSFAAWDMDGDGDQDLAIVLRGDDFPARVQILRNDYDEEEGQLIFAFDEVYGEGEGPVLVSNGDITGNGAQDLVTVNIEESSFAPMSGMGGPPANPFVRVQGNVTGSKPGLPGDLNGDGVVNLADLLILLTAWGPCADPLSCPADLNGDGIVNLADLLALLGYWTTS